MAKEEAERAKWAVLEAEQNKKSKIITAQGEAQSARDIGMAMRQNPAYLDLLRLAEAVNIAQVVTNSNNRMYLDADSLLLNINKDVRA